MSGRGAVVHANAQVDPDPRSAFGGLSSDHLNERLSELFYPELEDEVAAFLEHRGRFNLLCCLHDGKPLSAPQLSAKADRPLKLVVYDLELLKSLYLVEETGDPDGGEPLYATTLDEHRNWVRSTVEGRCGQ